uniref:Uncharacterized protein n=1 Tax=Leersia perrieri TaxID=77586 RepID=A0A0D9XZ12_9ORYZ
MSSSKRDDTPPLNESLMFLCLKAWRCLCASVVICVGLSSRTTTLTPMAEGFASAKSTSMTRQRITDGTTISGLTKNRVRKTRDTSTTRFTRTTNTFCIWSVMRKSRSNRRRDEGSYRRRCVGTRSSGEREEAEAREADRERKRERIHRAKAAGPEAIRKGKYPRCTQ